MSNIVNDNDNKQESPNLRMRVESYKNIIWLIINLKAIINLILQI